MAGRVALVVGSQCDRMTKLDFVEATAADLHSALTGAGWRPAGDDCGLLLNPSAEQLGTALRDSFAAANASAATLLFSFIGHGVATGQQDFYLMARDSPYEDPDRFLGSDTALDFTHFLKERVKEFDRIDGLVLIIDACQAQEGIEGAAGQWTRRLAENRGRMELLVASGKAAAGGKAYEGCFTKTILHAFAGGLPKRGDALLAGDIHPEISARCVGQSQYLAYSGGNLGGGDPGLWLVPNIARNRDAVTGRPAAGLVDQLTSSVIATDTVRTKLATVDESRGARLRLLVGAAGSGKSTLLALLIRPRLIDTLELPDGYIKAAVFLDTRSTVETLAAEMSAQLSSSVPGFGDAVDAVAAELTTEDIKERGVWETSVTMPLALVQRKGLHLSVIVDGLDQPEPGARELIVAAVQQITDPAHDDQLGHVRVIVGVRSDAGIDTRVAFTHARRIDIEPPTPAEIARAATTELQLPLSEVDLARVMGDLNTGGWLIARLIREIADRVPEATAFDNLAELVTARIEFALAGGGGEPAERMLTLIAAAGVGPVLPIRLLASAISDGDQLTTLVRIRDYVVGFGTLISRGNPGTDREALGVSHQALLDPIEVLTANNVQSSEWAHRTLVDAYNRHFVHVVEQTDDAEESAVASYWAAAAPRHYLGSGDALGAIRFLESLDIGSSAANRDRWSSWMPMFATTVGPDDPATLTARRNLAHWQGEAGDIVAAIAELESILADEMRVFGADDRRLLLSRGELAGWRGRAGDVARAAAEFETLVEERVRLLGPNDPSVLLSRRDAAIWHGEAGDASGAVAELEVLLRDQLQRLNIDDPDVLATRGILANWRGRAGYTRSALRDLNALMKDQAKVLGPNDRKTLATTRDMIYWLGRGRSGNKRAVAEICRLLLDVQERIFGCDDPDTLRTRLTLAELRYSSSGDATACTAELETLVADCIRVLGVSHPDTFEVRSRLGEAHGRGGDIDAAVLEFEELFADRLRILGPDHPSTMRTLGFLADWRTANESLTQALADYQTAVEHQTWVLGENHPDTLHTREALADCYAKLDDVPRAVSEYEALLNDMEPLWGSRSEATLRVRRALKFWRGEWIDESDYGFDFENE